MRIVKFLLLSLFSVQACAVTEAKIAIIIDDIGYQKTDLQLIDLPFALTFAVLPYTPYGQRAAKQAFQQQKDVMLHMPMQASTGKLTGPGALTVAMSKQQVRHTRNHRQSD